MGFMSEQKIIQKRGHKKTDPLIVELIHVTPQLILAFTEKVMYWHYHTNTRELAWKEEKDPYKIWLSEIILQQTRAEQGLPYYLRFTEAYPSIHDLAAAADDEVFKVWEGLGYYVRCRNMLATARQVAFENDGRFPDTYDSILQLKGIGPYTAAAIASFAFGLPYAVVDGNVYRVLARYFGVMQPTDGTIGKKLFQSLADQVLDLKDPAGFNQAIMDLGATVCMPARPDCLHCPLGTHCVAFRDGLTSILPIRAKKTAVRTRYFNYLIVHSDAKIWINRRQGKDIWAGLYEPFLLETEVPINAANIMEYSGIPSHESIKKPVFEGELSQKLSHQIIKTRFFSIYPENTPQMPAYGSWIPALKLKEFPFPKTLLTFFEKKGYF